MKPYTTNMLFELRYPVPKGVFYNKETDQYEEAIFNRPNLVTKAVQHNVKWFAFKEFFASHINEIGNDLIPARLIGGSKQGTILYLTKGVKKIQFGDEVYRISVMAGSVSGAGQFYSGNWLAGHLINQTQEKDESNNG